MNSFSALETGLGFNVDEPTAPHADFTRVFTLHGYPMKCGPTEKFEGGTCIPDPEAEGGDDYEGDYGAASDAEGAEESYGAPADYDYSSGSEAEESYGAPAEEALGEYAASQGRRGRKASKGRKAGRKNKLRKTQRRKTQNKRTQGKRTQRKRTQRRRTQRKGKKAQRKQRRRQ